MKGGKKMELSMIKRGLEEIPALKSRIAQEAEDLRLKYEQKKEETSRQVAKMLLSYKIMFPDYKQNEIKAKLEDDNDLHQARLDLIMSESEWKRKEIRLQELDDKFTGIKVLARLSIQELATLNQGD